MSGDVSDRAKAALERVTEGPWEVVYETEEGEYIVGERYAYAIHGPADHATLDSDTCSDDYKARYGHQITEIVGLSDADAEFIAAARSLVPDLVAEIDRLQAQADVMHRCIAERPQFLTAIKNCAPDNDSDYWRWQAHAEVRRQLAESLAALEVTGE